MCGVNNTGFSEFQWPLQLPVTLSSCLVQFSDILFLVLFEAGFNAGDGNRFTMIPGSRTSAVLNLPRTSNVAIPGRWMFRIDQAKIEVGGCNVEGLG